MKTNEEDGGASPEPTNKADSPARSHLPKGESSFVLRRMDLPPEDVSVSMFQNPAQASAAPSADLSLLNQTSLEQLSRVKDYKEQIDLSFDRMDGLLNRVLSKQEYDYLRGYNVFVKNKERNLKELIEKLNERNSTSNTKDKKINNLELEIDQIRTEQKRLED